MEQHIDAFLENGVMVAAAVTEWIPSPAKPLYF
jgi:hypothetical protein